MISLALSAGAFAQKGFYRPHRVFTQIYVAPALGLGFNYGYPFFGYPYFGYPYGYGPYAYRPMASSRLNSEINAVKSEYRHKIKAVRKDKSISSAQRKQNISKLKSDRENAIADVEKNFSKRQMNMMNNNQNLSN